MTNADYPDIRACRAVRPRVEFLRFEEGSPMPELLQTTPHAAFVVENLAEAMAGKEVVLEPFDVAPEVRKWGAELVGDVRQQRQTTARGRDLSRR